MESETTFVLEREDQRNRQTRELVKWFGDKQDGFFITLNLDYRQSKQVQSVTSCRFIALEAGVRKTIDQLNDYCYGRQVLKDKRLKSAFCIEIGKESGCVHTHIVAAHNGDVNRSLRQTSDLLKRKWKRFISNDWENSLEYVRWLDTTGKDFKTKQLHGENFDNLVDVQSIDTINDRVWYLTKQTNYIGKAFQSTNLFLH